MLQVAYDTCISHLHYCCPYCGEHFTVDVGPTESAPNRWHNCFGGWVECHPPENVLKILEESDGPATVSVA
jgi:hypothetical protein